MEKDCTVHTDAALGAPAAAPWSPKLIHHGRDDPDEDTSVFHSSAHIELPLP